MNENKTEVVYAGSRGMVEKRWLGLTYVFEYGKPRAVVDDFAKVLIDSGSFTSPQMFAAPLDERFQPGAVIVQRWGALGDVMMFRAACAAFLRESPGYEFALRTQDRFVPLFANDPIWKSVLPLDQLGVHNAVGRYSFDQVAEADHRGVTAHRATLFLKAMTNRTITIKPDDWKIPAPPAVATWVETFLLGKGMLRATRRHPLIALQVRGSGPMKSLPEAEVMRLINTLSAKCDIVLIENDETVGRRFEINDQVFGMYGRDALHGIELLRHVDLAITMDSGALWMAHAAPCPTLLLLGPTRESERLTMHPFYPERAASVALNDLMGCPSCFEAAKACGGKFACMREHPNWDAVHNAIVTAADRLLAPVSV